MRNARHAELLALGMFGRGLRVGERIEVLLARGREFSARASLARVAMSAAAMVGFAIAGSSAPRWVAFAQTAPPVEFEEASVRVNSSGDNGGRIDSSGPAGWEATNSTLQACIRWAYDVKDFQISGGPGWMNSARLDIAARASGRASPQQKRLMLQALLAARFRLVLHRETKVLPVYELVVRKGAAKLQASAPDASTSVGARMGLISGSGIAPSLLAKQLSGLLDRVVLDKTGLLDKYDLKLEWAPDGADDAVGPSLFTAIQEQLGLKLDAQQGPVEVLVVDHVERPGEN